MPEVFAINKSNRSVPLSLKIDGQEYRGRFRHESFWFNSMDERRTFALEESALRDVTPSEGGVVLPPLSINRISELRVEGVDDENSNNLSDTWEYAFFGNLSTLVSGDEDHDGASNWEEFFAGTNPVDLNSILRIDQISSEPADNLLFKWKSVKGRYYHLQRSAQLGGGWHPVSDAMAGVDGMSSIALPLESGSEPAFFRIVVE